MMGNYKFKESEPAKRPLDHTKLQADLKGEMKHQVIISVILSVALAGIMFIVIEWEGMGLNTIIALCVAIAIFAFVFYTLINRYVKIVKRKYVVELDTVIAIERDAFMRSAHSRISDRFVRFRNNGDYPINRFTCGSFGGTEVGDTFYVVRYEKKFGIKMPDAVYSTKKYEWNEEKKD